MLKLKTLPLAHKIIVEISIFSFFFEHLVPIALFYFFKFVIIFEFFKFQLLFIQANFYIRFPTVDTLNKELSPLEFLIK